MTAEIANLNLDTELIPVKNTVKRLVGKVDTSYLKPQQLEIFEACDAWFKAPLSEVPRYFVISGEAGTGKTTLLSFITEHILNKYSPTVILTAPTHPAVKVIRNNINFISSRLTIKTTHSYLNLTEHIDTKGNVTFVPKLKHGSPVPPDNCDLLIEDECGMIGVDLLKYTEDSPANKILFVGDINQLRPVKEGKSQVFQLDCEVHYLTENIRQGEGSYVLQQAKAILEGQGRLIPDEENIFNLNDKDQDTLDSLLKYYYTHPNYVEDVSFFRCLAFTNETVNWLNSHIRSLLFEDGEYGEFVLGECLYTKRPVKDEFGEVFLNNNGRFIVKEFTEEVWDLGEIQVDGYRCTVEVSDVVGKTTLKELSIIKKKDEKKFHKLLDDFKKVILSMDERERKPYWSQWFHIRDTFVDYGYMYATTTHRGQGDTINNILMVQTDMISKCYDPEQRKELIYTAATRAKKYIYLC